MVDESAARPAEAAASARSIDQRATAAPDDRNAAGSPRVPPDRPAEPEPLRREETNQEARPAEEQERSDQEERSAIPGPGSVEDLAEPYGAARPATGVQHQGDMLGGQSVGSANNLYQTNVYNNSVPSSAGGGRVAVGTVEPELLAKACSVVVPPGITDRAMRILRDQRVVVLQGRPHWGKASLALWLLSRVGRDDGGPWPEVYAIAPQVSLGDLPEGFFTDEARLSSRYVVDTLDPGVAGTLRLPVLRALCGQLGRGYLVITIDSRTPIPRIELSGYLVRCEELPDAEVVLRSNLRWRLDGQEPPDPLLGMPWVRRELGRRPVPGHLDQLAEVLAGVARRLVDETDAEAAYAGWVRLRVEEWFESHPDLPERCLMVAAAVLNGVSYHEVADAAARLQALLEPPEPDEPSLRLPSWGLASPRGQLVEDIGARVVSELRQTALGPCRAEVLELEDLRQQREVLEHLWEGHDVVRSTLLAWLEELGHYRNLEVSGRAAAAVGALCRKDLPYLRNRLLVDWAAAPQLAARVSAAVALDVVARDPDLARHVRAMLRRWIRRAAGSRLAWTATAAYGFHVGQRWPSFALRDLQLVVESAPHHIWVAGRSLANLCEAGKAAMVLDRIAEWAAVDDPPEAGEPALRVFVGMLDAGVDADVLAAGARPETGGTIPMLLRLAAGDEGHRARVVGLWKQAFQRVETRGEAIDALASGSPWPTSARRWPRP